MAVRGQDAVEVVMVKSTAKKQPAVRVRTSRACAACVARKVKCDGTPSCATCRDMALPCFYLPVTRKRGPPKGCPARGGVKKKVKPIEGEASSDSSGTPNVVAAVTVPPSPPQQQQQQKQRVRASTVSEHVAPAMLVRTDSAATTLDSILHDTHQIFADGQVPDLSAAGQLPPLHDDWSDHNNGNAAPAVYPPVPRAALHASSSSSSSTEPRPGRWLPEPIVDSLLLIYETFIHPHWPMVYMPALRSLRALDSQSPLLFDAILAISAANCDTKRDQDGNGGMYRFDMPTASGSGSTPTAGDNHKALVALSEEMLESVRRRIFARGLDKGDVATVQALVLVSLVDLGYGRSSLAYQMGGMASRMACDMGLNMIGTGAAAVAATATPRSSRRTPLFASATPVPTPPRPHAASAGLEERKRTIWACYTLDKILSAILQRPVALRAADIATPRPSELERDELELLMVGTAQQRFLHASACAEMDYVKSHALSTFNAWCDIMVIVESTLDRLYVPAAYDARVRAATNRSSAHVTTLLEEQERFVAQIEGALAAWRKALPAHLQWTHDHDSDDDRDVEQHTFAAPHILTVRGWYHTCKILVHRPRVPHLYYQTIITSPAGGGGGADAGGDVDAVEALRLLKHAAPNSTGSVNHSQHASRSAAAASLSSAAAAVPNGLDAARDAATSLCHLMEAYEKTFKVRKFPSSWVYLVFQAGTVHAGLALPSAKSRTASPAVDGQHQLRHQHVRASIRLDQCIRWLDQIALTWVSASHHVQLLRRLSEVGAHTRPLRPLRGRQSAPDTGAASTPCDEGTAMAKALAVIDTSQSFAQQQQQHQHQQQHQLSHHTLVDPSTAAILSPGSTGDVNQDLLDSWSLFWGVMPTTSEDVSLWQDFSGLFQ